MRKLLNVISYALNVVFIVFIAVMLTKQNEGAVESQPEEPQEEVQPEESDAERVKRMVVERERADIPLHEQEYEGVNSITIDSMVLTQTRPYAGYLVTTWNYNEKYERSDEEMDEEYRRTGHIGDLYGYREKSKTVYVKIPEINLNRFNGDLSWRSNWLSAYMSLSREIRGF